jgi:predicted metal-dependent enzyme (double-stranded beta helix superfamily)
MQQNNHETPLEFFDSVKMINDFGSIDKNRGRIVQNAIQLIHKGQGLVEVFPSVLYRGLTHYIWIEFATENSFEKGISLILEFTSHAVTLLTRVESQPPKIVQKFTGSSLLLDSTNRHFYWVSIDSKNNRLIFGVGESRYKENELYCQKYDLNPTFNFLKEARLVFCSGSISHFDVQPMPLGLKTPLLVHPGNSMENIFKKEYTNQNSLTAECQNLYSNIAGEDFILNTSDFPDFYKAIHASCVTKGGICFEKLQKKKPGWPEDRGNYLRITLGENDGNSMGVPYVMEIWPPGCFSAVHNHGGAHAIIRILKGEIKTFFYPYLSQNPLTPLDEAILKEGDITYMHPKLNQIHKLMNDSNMTCVTIQCYQYGVNDSRHYEFFDYAANNTINKFTPNSDFDFASFKKLLQQESMKLPVERYDLGDRVAIRISATMNSYLCASLNQSVELTQHYGPMAQWKYTLLKNMRFHWQAWDGSYLCANGHNLSLKKQGSTYTEWKKVDAKALKHAWESPEGKYLSIDSKGQVCLVDSLDSHCYWLDKKVKR